MIYVYWLWVIIKSSSWLTMGYQINTIASEVIYTYSSRNRVAKPKLMIY